MKAGSKPSGRGGEFRCLLMLTCCQLLCAPGRQKCEAILVLSREPLCIDLPLCIEFPTSLSPKGNITWFSSICIHWEKTNGCIFAEWKGCGEEVSCAPISITSSCERCVLIIRDQHLKVTVHTYKTSLSYSGSNWFFRTNGIGVNFSLRNKSHLCFVMPCFLTYVIVFLWEDRARFYFRLPPLPRLSSLPPKQDTDIKVAKERNHAEHIPRREMVVFVFSIRWHVSGVC